MNYSESIFANFGERLQNSFDHLRWSHRRCGWNVPGVRGLPYSNQKQRA